ncbi:1900_t:CDS:2 [Acaulospora colombiana]|uniref:1900_t:CDS:1 n=1 Tax=Acaulospora colombiana TaxID=27376 RepID=A0ACA9KSJ3_9GLOM|nr:1900_t:CDS:2 [Acaulospora colombiana]
MKVNQNSYENTIRHQEQHGSVYWSDSALNDLTSLDPSETLVSQLTTSFAIPNSPTWQDSSTSVQCKNLEKLIGGPEVLANITGSRGFERFTGNHIAKARHTRDNPATILSFYLQPEDVVISLGTSDTVLIYTATASPTLESHTLCHPTDPDAFISMLCYKNGSLTREYVRNMYCPNSGGNDDGWLEFNKHLSTTLPDPAKIGFYFLHPEIIPFAKGIYRFFNKELISEFVDSPEYNIRAIIESQFMSMKLRVDQLAKGNSESSQDNDGEKNKGHTKRIMVVGGASKNDEILQVLADVFGVCVWRCNGGGSASFGAAIKARMSFLRANKSSKDIGEDRRGMSAYENGCELVAKPRRDYHAVYQNMMKDYRELEKFIVEKQKIINE